MSETEKILYFLRGGMDKRTAFRHVGIGDTKGYQLMKQYKGIIVKRKVNQQSGDPG